MYKFDYDNFFRKITKIFRSVVWLLVGITFLIGWIFGSYQKQSDFIFSNSGFNNNSGIANNRYSDFSLFRKTWGLVSEDFFNKEEIIPQKMLNGAIYGMVSSIGDPYTLVLTKNEKLAFEEYVSKDFEGIGAQLSLDNKNRIVVFLVYKNTPADKAGLKKGDELLEIDGKKTANLSPITAQGLLRKPKGTKISIAVSENSGKQTRQISLITDKFKLKTVDFHLITSTRGKKIGYIKVSGFNNYTIEEWNNVVSSNNPNNLDGIILDLRDNYGGHEYVPIYIASEFIHGSALYLEDKGGIRTVVKKDHETRFIKTPVAVLVNGTTTSAGELLADLIQYHKRGVLVGVRTFGKNTTQEFFDLPKDFSLIITTAKWYMLNGESVAGKGLSPDFKVQLTENEYDDLQSKKGIQILDDN